MGLSEKISHTVEDLKGKAKEAVGKVTDDRSLTARGKADQAKAALRDAGERMKGTFRKLG